MATISNLYIDQGTTFSTVVDLQNQDGTVMDLGGYSVASQMRKSYQSSSFTPFVASVENPTAGQIKLVLAADTSSAMKAGRYLYDVEITNLLSGEKFRVLEGIAILTPEITR